MAFADLCRFVPTLGGTTDWVYSSAVGGCQSPTLANVVAGLPYRVYAVSNDLTQWEVSTGVNTGGTTFPRTTVLYNSSGSGTAAGQSGAGTKISFSTVPQVSIVALAEDFWNPAPPQGRLTLTSGLPVMTSSVTAATSVIFTPTGGNLVPIYNGVYFVPTPFAEISQLLTDATKSPAAATTNSNYDMFVWSDAGTVRCTRGPLWSSNTSRGTGAGTSQISLVNGIMTNTVAITNGPGAGLGTYVGTIHTNGTSTVDFIIGGAGSGGVAGSMCVWNMYNRAWATMNSVDNGAGYTYALGIIRQARASSGNQCSFVVGLIEDAFAAYYQQRMDTAATSGTYGGIAIGVDSTTVNTSPMSYLATVAAVTNFATMISNWTQYPALGFHTLAAVETTSAQSITFNNSSAAILSASLWN